VWARLVRDGHIVAQSWFDVHGTRGTVSLAPSLHPAAVPRTGSATLDVQVYNLSGGPLTTTLHLRAVDARGALYHTATLTVPLTGSEVTEATHIFTMPADAATGTGLVWVEARSPHGAAGGAAASLTVPASPLAFSLLPPPPLAGESTASLGLVLTNTAASLPIERGALTLPPLTFGNYTLAIDTSDEYGARRQEVPWPATPVVQGTLDQLSYRARDLARLDLTLANPGPFILPLTATLQSPISSLPYSHTHTPFTIPIPPGVAPGHYPLTLTLALPSGALVELSQPALTTPPSRLALSAAPLSLAAGEVLDALVTNEGGVDTTARVTFRLLDARGAAVVSHTATLPVQAGAAASVPLTLPTQSAGGTYTFVGQATDLSTGVEEELVRLVAVAGTEAALSVSTGPPT